MQPNKPCARSGCPALALKDSRYCARHLQADKKRKQDQDKKRGSSCKRGYDRVWQRYRLRYLAEHPLCVDCESRGRIVPATVIDHKQSHKGDRILFWDEGNHRALCKRCHDQATAKFDGGFGNPTKHGKTD